MELEHLRTQVRDATYTQMPEIFVAAFPFLRETYDFILTDWIEFANESPGVSILFEEVICTQFADLLRSPALHERVLEKYFTMLEEMACHQEQDVRNLLAVSICSKIIHDGPATYYNALPFIGPAMHWVMSTLPSQYDDAPHAALAQEPPPATVPRGSAIPDDWHDCG